ncbi:hypothetical protein A2U01_0079333, partial [Trifolium medium]|nr:hypothetical protein [Trifolium medium]
MDAAGKEISFKEVFDSG